MKDKLDQAKGRAREAYGKAAGDRKQEIRGKAEQVKGKAGEAAKDIKKTVKR